MESIDAEAARRTRSIIMFLGPLLHRMDSFKLPYAGGCDLGTRTIEPHMIALRRFGLDIAATEGLYHAQVDRSVSPGRPIVLTERGDTVTENALLAAARHESVTVIRNASSNYMVQDLCFFLEALGVKVEGIGTTTLTVHGVPTIDVDVDYSPSEDPVEAMSLLAAAVVTESELTVRRVPIEFLEIELAVLEEMGLDHDRTPEYVADNGRTRLVDLTVRPSKLEAPIDKIHPMPFPGLNIDNVPFFAAIAAVAQGQTLIHDWVYDNRAIYLTDLNRLGGRLQLLDPHRVLVEGPTRWRAAEMMCPCGAAARGGRAARDDGGGGHVRAAERVCHQPRLRGPGGAAQLRRGADRDLPRHLRRCRRLPPCLLRVRRHPRRLSLRTFRHTGPVHRSTERFRPSGAAVPPPWAGSGRNRLPRARQHPAGTRRIPRGTGGKGTPPFRTGIRSIARRPGPTPPGPLVRIAVRGRPAQNVRAGIRSPGDETRSLRRPSPSGSPHVLGVRRFLLHAHVGRLATRTDVDLRCHQRQIVLDGTFAVLGHELLVVAGEACSPTGLDSIPVHGVTGSRRRGHDAPYFFQPGH